MNKIIFLGTLILILAACSNSMQHKIGIKETLPDEYQVKKLKPLENPSKFELPEPVDAMDEKENIKSTNRNIKEAKESNDYSDAEKALLEQTRN